jgi:hypothetical protein
MVKSNFVGLLASVLLATSAFAAPKVGDQILLEGTYSATGVEMQVSLEKKVSAYNANTDVFAVDTTQKAGPDVQTTSENVASGDMLSEEVAAQIVEACAGGIGSVEEIQVKAGSFRTCHTTMEGQVEIWIAPVPFGVVKLRQKAEDGATTNLELSSFTRGN